jgi:hypothetical protein
LSPLPTKKIIHRQATAIATPADADQPNIRIHADLFGPMLAAGHQHKYILCIKDAFMKYILCITDAFTKYILCITDAFMKTVAKAIFPNGFVNSVSQIHTDGRKEFVNKLSRELFDLLNVEHTKTTPTHPQCNAQVEVFNKTVKKYLASFMDNTTLDWENFVPALMLSYNTSYHLTIGMTLFELLFGNKPRLHHFQIQTYSKCTTANLLQLNITNYYKKFDLLPKTLRRQF